MSFAKSPIVKIILALVIGLAIFVGSFYASSQALLYNFFNRSVWITLLVYHSLVLILSFLAILIFSRGKIKTFGFNNGSSFPVLKILLNSILIGVIAGYVIYTFNKEELGFIAFYKTWEKIVFIWLIASISEEMLVSGFIQGYMMPAKKYAVKIFKTTISIPMILSAIVFAIIYVPHLIGMKIIAIALIMFVMFAIGISKAYFREKTNSLLAPMVMHVLFNAAIFAVVYFMK